jgi:hypothetical protein
MRGAAQHAARRSWRGAGSLSYPLEVRFLVHCAPKLCHGSARGRDHVTELLQSEARAGKSTRAVEKRLAESARVVTGHRTRLRANRSRRCRHGRRSCLQGRHGVLAHVASAAGGVLPAVSLLASCPQPTRRARARRLAPAVDDKRRCVCWAFVAARTELGRSQRWACAGCPWHSLQPLLGVAAAVCGQEHQPAGGRERAGGCA